MDNPFPKGSATEVKMNSAYNYLLMMSKTSKETNKPNQTENSESKHVIWLQLFKLNSLIIMPFTLAHLDTDVKKKKR